MIHSSLFSFLSQDGVKMTLVEQSSIPRDLLPATVVPGLEAFTVTAGVGLIDGDDLYYPLFNSGRLLGGLRRAAVERRENHCVVKLLQLKARDTYQSMPSTV